jgi:4-hydroxy-tetrahydrodipicolinate reductase
MTLRVIQWGTGHVGVPALRALVEHPDLELVGLHAHSPAKLGRDAAELCGLAAPSGVRATNDAAALLALPADCVVYTAIGETRPSEAVADLCRILASGKNVVSSSLVSLVYPPFAHPRLRDALRKACEAGHTSLFTNGIDPGFSGDLLPLAILNLCERVDSVRVMELMNYATYPDPDFTGAYFGFGRPLAYEPPLLRPGALKWGWGGMLQIVADALDVALDEIREVHERRVAESSFETAVAKVEAGTVAAVRFRVEGCVGGEPVIVAEHVNRVRDDVAPDWPRLASPKTSGYRVEINGSPSFTCELELAGEDGDHNTAGITATAARLVNAIPAVCAAPPGLLSPLDLPVTTRGAVRASRRRAR